MAAANINAFQKVKGIEKHHFVTEWVEHGECVSIIERVFVDFQDRHGYKLADYCYTIVAGY